MLELRDKVKAKGLYQNRLTSHQMSSISYINDISASIHPITTALKNAKRRRKSVRSTTPAADCNRYHFILHFCLRHGWHAKSSILPQRARRPDFHPSLHAQDIPKGLYNGKLKTKQTTRDHSSAPFF